MFTGIITHLGKVVEKENKRLTILADRHFLSKIQKGMSVCVNGVCLTIVRATTKYLEVDFMPETESRTSIKYLQPDDLVDLELPATPATFLSGHIVQGHVDGIAKLDSIEKQKNSHILKFIIPEHLSKYLVEKGSVAVNGISLTVIKAAKKYFTVGIIPFTWDNTMLSTIKIGDFVNIEVDILAKYVERLVRK